MSVSVISAYAFPGSISLTNTSLVDALDASMTAITSTIPNVQAFSKQVDRKTTTAQDIDYYIQADDDLNAYLGVISSSSVSGQDDTWYFGSGAAKDQDIVTSSSQGPTPPNVVKRLPTFSGKRVLVKKINLFSVDGYTPLQYQWYNNTTPVGAIQSVSSVGQIRPDVFRVYVTLNSNASGTITPVTTSIENTPNVAGDDFSQPWTKIRLLMTESLLKAQKVGFGFMDLTFTDPTDSGADVLFADIDANTLATSGDAVTAKLDAIRDLYANVNLLASWSFTFTAQPKDAVNAVDNAISKHARTKGWTEAGTKFVNGDKIVTSAGQILTVTVKDVDNADVVLLDNNAANTVYGVLNHQDPA